MNARRWDWKVYSYADPHHRKPMLVTTHRGQHSLDMELHAIKACGRYPVVVDLRV